MAVGHKQVEDGVAGVAPQLEETSREHAGGQLVEVAATGRMMQRAVAGVVL